MDPQTKSFSIIVKPNARKSRIVKFDADKNAYILEIAAKPENNKANLEVIRFLSHELRKRVSIVKGLTSREKIIRIIES